MTAVPRSIGRYEVRAEIGRGSMGVVYEAFDPDLERAVALKTFDLGVAVSARDRESFEARFFTEARIAARLSHPGIVIVHDTGRDAGTGTLFMVLELLKGRTLARLLKEEGPLPWREALRIAADVAEALHHGHGMQVVHRDIKPANLMLLAGCQPKIMDFGVARIESTRANLTRSGQFLGTPLYMSPEHALGQTVDHRIDLFALGAVAYELVTGRPAFAAASLTEIVARVVLEDPAPASQVIDRVPPEVDYVLARALAKDREARYPHGAAMAEDMADLLAGRSPRHRDGWTPPPPGAHPRITAQQAARLREAASLPPAVENLEDPSTRTLPVVGSPASPRRRSRVVIAAAGAFVALVGSFVLAAGIRTFGLRRPPPAASSSPAAAQPSRPARPAGVPTGSGARAEMEQPSDAQRPSAAAAVAESAPPAPAPAAAAGDAAMPMQAADRPARLAIDFEHSLKKGTLRVWVDGNLMLSAPVEGRVKKKVLLLKSRRGVLAETLEVSPGEHEVKVQVGWDENVRVQSVTGTFRAGATRRLAARFGGLLRRNLSLEWE